MFIKHKHSGSVSTRIGSDGSDKIEKWGCYASKTDYSEQVPGVKVYKGSYWSSYA